MDPGLPSEAFAEVDGAYDFDFDRVVLSSWRQNMTIDEIRIGSTWENVTAAGLSSYASWSSGFATPADGDENGDGIPNLVAYAVGATSTESAHHLLPTILASGSTLDYAIATTPRADVVYEILASDNMSSWNRIAYKDAGSSWLKDNSHPWSPSITVTPTAEGVLVEVAAVGSPDTRFFRLSVVLP
jgi:hypothetical protein